MHPSGLPPYHPLVEAQGSNGSAVDQALRHDAAEVTKAGYNLKGRLGVRVIDLNG